MNQINLLNRLPYVFAIAAYLVLINLLGWFSDEYQDMILYTTLGTFTVLLIKRGEQLQKLQENQKRMLLDISHTLQTPLAVFQTRLELLKNTVLDDTAIDTLEHSLNDLSQFINDLLRLARLEHSPEGPHTPLNFSALIEDVFEEIQPIASNLGVTTENKIGTGIYVQGDSAKLREAIRNLVSNALKYTPQENGKISFSLRRKDMFAVFALKDSGVGISREDLPHIFERFWRAKNSEHVPGSGLGLALAKHIIERHNGTLTAKSGRGQGSTFEIRLPFIS